MGNDSQFGYDGFGHIVKILEGSVGAVTSTRQFVTPNLLMQESRDSIGSLISQYFENGIVSSATNHFYSRNHDGSVTEMIDSFGNGEARYLYDPFGRVNTVSQVTASDFQFGGYYFHSRSGMSVTIFRFYNAVFGRWLNRDPVSEGGGINLYQYALNDPVTRIDPFGYFPGIGNLLAGTKWCGSNCSNGACGGKFGEDSPGMPMGPGDQDFLSPVSPLDWCCYVHDLCMHFAHTLPDPKRRCIQRKNCHDVLSNCADKVGGGRGFLGGLLFGTLSITGSNDGSNDPVADPRMPYTAPAPGEPPTLRGPISE